ncbi:NADH-quinone oxidoreductase subunit D [Luteococcus sp. OSA5]|uniref:NADH-quinone oxidoreductase subunit D-related protein n=1 Tax=Luteococcus sp. OSA5 TaxID=3401630 RepID=UPI003B4308FB
MTQILELSIGSLGRDWQSSDGSAERMHLDLGPDHPSRTGLLLARLEADDGVVTQARIQPGFNHRSAEKLFEVRDYRQVLMLADRHDWHSPFTGELGAAMVCEQLMGLVPPRRAVWLRTLLAEQARIASHLSHLSFVAHHTNDEPLAQRIRSLRERGRELVLEASGNRVHPMLNRLGGLATDLDNTLVEGIREWAAASTDCADDIARCVTDHELGRAMATTNRSLCEDHGLSGPVARACGLDWDLRRRNPHLAYADLQEILAQGNAAEFHDGDAFSRFLALTGEIATSFRLIDAIAGQLPSIDGPIDTKLSKIIKLPEAEAYLALEAPWGMAGFWLVSRADRTPWRLKLRTPSFANVQALQVALQGCALTDLAVAFASLGWTSGDLDK